MTDRIIRATGARTPMRLVLADITGCANEIGEKHGACGYSLKLLAETAISSLFLSSGLKFPGTVSVSVNFSGDISMIQADTTPQGLIRAMIPQADILATKNFEPALSPQTLRVVKLDAKGKRVRESIIDAVSESMGQNIATFLLQSEQTRSAVGIEAKINEKNPRQLDYAVGFMLEAYPDLETKDIEILEQVVLTLPPLEDFFDGSHYSLSGLMDMLAGPYEVEVVKEIIPEVFCPCSKVRTLATLSSFTTEDLEYLLEKNEDLEIICDFCRNRYIVTPDEIQNILNQRIE
ncbi:MAG: Hsp33 family molecular chaperone HslO [Fibrobacter sp.]|jgi:molecular chaperone Hsp33|nr:Hsp33 family molecular chaperone HslO [Fibrobacter sp.]